MNLQKILRAIGLSALFLIPIFALFPTPVWPLNFPDGMFFPFITGKAFYFRILVEIALVCWAVLAFLDARYRPRFNALTIGITLFAVVALVADLLGVNIVRSLMSNFERMEGWLVIAHLWAFFMSASGIFGAGEEGKRLWHRWFNTSLVIASIVTIYALCQQFGWAEIHQGSTRLDASLGNAAYLAVYLLMHIGVSMYLFFVARAKGIANASFLQWAYPILSIIFAIIILLTQTRGTLIGLAIGLVATCASYALFVNGVNYKKVLIILSFPFLVALYALFVLALGLFALSVWWLALLALIYFIALIVYVIKNRGSVPYPAARSGRWISIGIIALFFILGGVFYLVKDASFVKNSPSLDRIASISLTDTKTQARAYIWPMALKGFTERPILGWGQENFNYIFNANYNPKMWNQEQWFDRAHNVYLDWLVASGAVGLIVYLALYVLIILAVWRSSLSVSQKSVLTGLVIGYGIHNFFVFDNLASYIFFFALLGFAGSASSKRADQSASSKSFSLEAVEYIVLPVAIIIFVGGMYFLNVRMIQANTRLIDALISCGSRNSLPDPELFTKSLSLSATADQEVREQILSCAGGIVARQYPGPTKQAFYDLALQQIKAQMEYAPRDARGYVLAGSFLSNLNQAAEALPILEKAHELTPNKQTVAIQLANVYLGINRIDDALKLLKEAYEADPTFQDAKQAYILGLVVAKRDTEARAVASSTMNLFENDRTAHAYAVIKQYDKSIALFKILLERDPTSVPLSMQLVEVYTLANRKWEAIELVRKIAKDHPEYKDQVDAVIKQIQEVKVTQ